MTHISKTNKALLIILLFVSTILVIYLLLPKSVGDSWDIHMISNINLPDLGVDSDAASVNARSLIGYVAFMKILSVTCDVSTLWTCHIMVFLGVLYIFLSYFLIRRLIPGDKKAKRWVLFFYPILLVFLQVSTFTGYCFAPSMLLLFLLAFCLFYLYMYKGKYYSPIIIVLLVAWVSLGLFWQSYQMAAYALMSSFILVVSILFKRNRRYVFNWSLFILITIILIVTWLYLRNDVLEVILRGGFSIDFMSLLSKGSFVGPYQYKSTLPTEYIDMSRYVAYLLIYLLMSTITIRYLMHVKKRREVLPESISLASALIITFILAEIVMVTLYLFATRTVGTVIMILLTYPFILIYLDSKMGQTKAFLSKYKLNRILLIFLILSLALTSFSSLYKDITEAPYRNLQGEIYNSSFDWIVNNYHSARILSDSATAGNYQLLYSYHGIYKQKKFSMVSIGYNTYDKLAKIEYANEADAIFVLNTELYRNHLVYRSLESWNTFEPISPDIVDNNKQLNVIYNDNNILVVK